MWDQCATNVEPLSKAIKQFLPCLKAVVTKKERPIYSVIIKFIRKDDFSLKYRDFSALFKRIIFAIKSLFPVCPF